jgi:exodeoxyribonuclease-3
MKIATWNVNGIRAREAQFQAWLQTDAPEVVCLQEIKAGPLQIPPAICDLQDYWCYWHGAGGYSGVGLHISKRFSPERPEFIHPSFDHETRIVEARVGAVTFVSVYVPNGGKDFEAKMKFLESMNDYVRIKHNAGEQIVICGDVNIALTDRDVHPKERKPRAIGQLPEERKLLQKILDSGVVDVLRAHHPDDDGLFTWWAPWRNMRQRNIGWRLDYVLASAPLAEKISQCDVLRDIGTSDHAPVVATLNDLM